MKKLLLLLLALFMMQANYSQRRMENLDRGLMAVKVSNGVYLSWRILGQEWYDVGYNLYKNGEATPIATFSAIQASNYIDATGDLNSTYEVAPVYKDGTVGPKSHIAKVYPDPYFDIELAEIPRKTDQVPATHSHLAETFYSAYAVNDMTAADLTGDGQYELIVKRVNNYVYESQNGYATAADLLANPYNTLFDAYRYDRDQEKWVLLWRIDVGPNIHNDVEINILAFDFDGDGKAEVIMRSSEGTIDGKGNVIPDLGDAAGNWNYDGTYKDGITNYRDRMVKNSSYYEYAGPEFLSLYDGETGEELDRIEHIRRNYDGYIGSNDLYGTYFGTRSQSKGQLAHRALKFFYAAPYLDGQNPSLFISRGIYHNTVARAYNIIRDQSDNLKFSDMIWAKDFRSPDYGNAYVGQGNHNFSVADVDNDGCDEIIYGGMTINNDGTGLYSSGFGHGDAAHVGNFDPYRKGIEIFGCIEGSPWYGTAFRAAEDGTILLRKVAEGDEGRAIAGNFSNKYKGAQMRPSASGAFSASERKEISMSSPANANFRIYWDGDLLDEWLDYTNWTGGNKGVATVWSYNDDANSWSTLLTTTGHYTCNYTKATPSLQADLFGDWREELVLRNNDDSKIRVYFTTIPTEHRIYSLMHDMQYRQAVAWQMNGYNQPPHKSYFIGELEDITLPPPPLMSNGRFVYKSGGSWSNASWIMDGETSNYVDGKPVLFDFSADQIADNPNSNVLVTVSLNTTVAPENVSVYSRYSLNGGSRHEYKLEASGSGKMTGDMRLAKQGGGDFTLTGTHDFTGATEIWDGKIILDGELSNSSVWMHLFGELDLKGKLGNGLSMNYASVLYVGGEGSVGTVTINGDVKLRENSILEFDASSSTNDKIIITNGKLIFAEENAVIRINKSETLDKKDYVLMQVSEIQGDLSKVTVEGLGSQIGTLHQQSGELILRIEDVRAPNTITWTGAASDVWDIFGDENFDLNNVATPFITNDIVKFEGSVNTGSIRITEDVLPSEIIVNSEEDIELIAEDGKISGNATLTKDGSGKLTLTGVNDFNGPISILGGTLEVEKFPTLVNNGSIGVVSHDPDLFYVDNATVTYTGRMGMQTERAMKVGQNGATLNNPSELLWLSTIDGGTLTKTGTGNLRFTKANTLETLYLNAGTVSSVVDGALPAKTIVMGNGTTIQDKYVNGDRNFDIMVPEGASATMILSYGGGANYKGTLTGGGNLNLQVSYVRANINGDWSKFTGKITAVATPSSSYTPTFRIANRNGFPNAELALSGVIEAHQEGISQGVSIGALSGTSSSIMNLGSYSWTFGNRGTDSEFAGTISGAGRITKIGAGTFTLSGANTYTGTTTLSEGRLFLSTNGTTGTGNLTVAQDAIIAGQGTVKSSTTTVNGIIQPGNHTTGKWADKVSGSLTFDGVLTVTTSGVINTSVVNSTSPLSSKIIVNGAFVVSGALVVEVVQGSQVFSLGREITIFEFNGTARGGFSSFDLPETAEGTVWDTSTLLTDGKIRVISGEGISSEKTNVLQIQPNPADDFIMISLPTESPVRMDILDLSGNRVLSKEVVSNQDVQISELPQGLYLVRINIDGKVYVSKLVKK